MNPVSLDDLKRVHRELEREQLDGNQAARLIIQHLVSVAPASDATSPAVAVAPVARDVDSWARWLYVNQPDREFGPHAIGWEQFTIDFPEESAIWRRLADVVLTAGRRQLTDQIADLAARFCEDGTDLSAIADVLSANEGAWHIANHASTLRAAELERQKELLANVRSVLAFEGDTEAVDELAVKRMAEAEALEEERDNALARMTELTETIAQLGSENARLTLENAGMPPAPVRTFVTTGGDTSKGGAAIADVPPFATPKMIRCERCLRPVMREAGHVTAKGWLFLEAHSEFDPRSSILVSACSRSCAEALWREGPGSFDNETEEIAPAVPATSPTRPDASALEAAIRGMLASATPHPVEHPTMWRAWYQAEALLGIPPEKSRRIQTSDEALEARLTAKDGGP